jgi:hypothetical protein
MADLLNLFPFIIVHYKHSLPSPSCVKKDNALVIPIVLLKQYLRCHVW